MIARSAASIVIATALLLGASACSYATPPASLIQYQPSDGTATSIGNIKARNVVAVSEDGETANLVFALINDGQQSETVNLQYTDASGTQNDFTVDAPAAASTPVGYDDGDVLTMTGLDVTVGGLVPVYLQYGDEEGKVMMVPVLDGTQPQFATLVPTAGPTATPIPSETPTPTPTSTDAP